MPEQTAFGRELRRQRTAAGLSLSQLAKAVHYSKGFLSKVETGAAQPHHALAVLCDARFDAGGTLVALVPRLRKPRDNARKPFGLPSSTTHFTGRSEEMDQVLDALVRGVSSARTCVIDGMAGVGKTALALAAGHCAAAHFPDGCLYVSLRGFSQQHNEMTSAEALDVMLRALGVPDDGIPTSQEARAHTYRSLVRGRRYLVVLDNARNVGQVLPLLPAESECGVLITSRNRLTALDDATHVSLSPLPPADGADLFRAISGQQGDTDLAAIVERCGRLPLALRIAAARYRANPYWTAADLELRLADEFERLNELDDGERSVAAAFRLSVRALSPEQHRMFGLLAIGPGDGFDVFAAAALAGTTVPEAGRLLDRLRDSHLLVQEGVDRYRMHDLLREFALIAVTPAVDEPDALSRLADQHLHALEQADHLLTPQRFRPAITYQRPPSATRVLPDRAAALAWLDVEWPNLVALCELTARIGLAVRCWQLAYFLREYFFYRRLCDPWVASHEHALSAVAGTGDRWAEAVTCGNLGMARLNRGDLDAALADFDKARTLFAELGDEHGVASTIAGRAWTYHYLGEHTAALADMRTAREFYDRTDMARNAAIARRGMALVRIELGEYGAAADDARDSLASFTALGLDNDAAMAWNCLGWNHFKAGEHEAAAEAYLRASDAAALCGSWFEEARAQTGLGNVAAAADDLATAEKHWVRAARLHPDLSGGDSG